MGNFKLKMAYNTDLRIEIFFNQFLPVLSKVSELYHFNTILSKSDKKNRFFFLLMCEPNEGIKI